MKQNILLLLLALVSLTGCGLTNETHRVWDLARRTTFIEPRFYDYVNSDKLAQREARLLAEQAWGEVAHSLPNASADYQNGFTEGFADYLYRGGEGEPPLIPPRGYWNLRFLNQFGKTSTNDWYEGFRRGADVCKSSGLREMWLVPTSLLVGNSEAGTLPVTEGDYYSSDPALMMMNQSLNPVNLAPVDRGEPSPPIPDSRPVTTDDDKGISASGNSPASEDSSDAADDEASLGTELRMKTLSDQGADDSSDPFGNDPLTPDTLTPNPVDPGTPAGNQDDIFDIPEGAFESSDSFEPEDDDFFDLQGCRSPTKSNAPLTIRSVQPAARIAEQAQNARDSSPIVLTSGAGDLPPPPEGMPLILSTDQAPPPPPRPSSVLPKGRPRMTKSRGTNASTLLGTSRVYDSQPIVRQPQAIATRPAPMQLEAPSRSTPSKSTSAKAGHDLSNMLPFDVPSLEMTAKQPSRSSQTASTPQPSKQDNPVIVWLDDDVPAQPEPIPVSPETHVIGSDEWEPFAPGDTESVEFGALQYGSVLDDGLMQRSTQWNPQRSAELPLRIDDPSQRPAPVTNSSGNSSGNSRMVIQQGPKQATNRTLKFANPRKSQAVPRIYMQQPASQTIQPTVESSTLSDESATSWRFRN